MSAIKVRLKKYINGRRRQFGKIDGAFFINLFIGLIIITVIAKLVKYFILS